MRRAFTLLEVMIAVSILAAALLVLVNSQATAVLMTNETDRTLTATMLAREKMAEIQVRMEKDGFGQSDIEEEGDFSNFGAEDPTAADLQLEIGDAYDGFGYAWTVRKVDITMAGDLASMAEALTGSGLFGGDQASTDASQSSSKYSDLASQKESPQDAMSQYSDMIGPMLDQYLELLGNFIREIRVVVWWGDNVDGTDQVELVSHIINPTGMVSSGDTTTETTSSSGSGNTGKSSKSGNSPTGGGRKSGAR